MDTAADRTEPPAKDWAIVALIGTGHFLSHFYMLCLPPLFLAWRDAFDVSFATLGLSIALMSGVTALGQTPIGFMVDRYGARRFLVGGTLLMALSISAMAFAPSFGWIVALAVLSGVGNSVIHPADYAILAGSVDKSRMGRAFALHTFTGNLGFALAPPTVALLLLVFDWRGALLSVGLLGVPVVGAILWQSRILKDQPKSRDTGPAMSGRELLLSRPILLFFAFFLLSSMAGSGFTAFIITLMQTLWDTPLAIASMLLTGYMVGATGGTLVGGWFNDRTQGRIESLMVFVTGLTLAAVALMLSLGFVPMPASVTVAIALVAGICTGASRAPRDVMLRNAAPPGQVGKVFGFVSSGLPLGGAIMPVPMGWLLDSGHPQLLLPLVSALLLLSLLCAGLGNGAARQPVSGVVPAE
ncbi:putative MFS family arabinose efflux permease [Humitalea rosea]|uniref:Putative MFS family arabinose efflux permease n=1 Tax=Humitalea rosea TaxID=990373 RepID=A0A2W7I2Y7_9PROT|nr:MFS transporter [Humitalea rosea]PZW41084.1 putative MFS family arabinose efflux permease [Humitalea rosea]